MDIDCGQLVGRRLKDIAVVVHLHEFAPVGRRPASGRDWRRFERLAKMRENLTHWPRLCDERDQPDVLVAVGKGTEGETVHQLRP